MAEDSRQRQRISRAEGVKQWAEGDDGLYSMFDVMQRMLLEQWSDSAHEEIELREHIWQRIQNLRDLRMIMEQVITSGVIAEKEIEHEEVIKTALKARH